MFKYLLILAINYKYTGLLISTFKFETMEGLNTYLHTILKSMSLKEYQEVITNYEYKIVEL